MKITGIDQINRLPFHDSSILAIKIEQDNNGNTEFQIGIQFLKDELVELGDSEKEYINKDGTFLLSLKDCRWIDLNMVSNSTRRDKIDFIRLLDNPEIQELKNIEQKFLQIEVTLISGSILKCVFNAAYISAI